MTKNIHTDILRDMLKSRDSAMRAEDARKAHTGPEWSEAVQSGNQYHWNWTDKDALYAHMEAHHANRLGDRVKDELALSELEARHVASHS